MKKLLLMIVGAFMLSTSLWAKTLVPLSVTIEEDDQPAGTGYGRGPIEVPLVYIEDYTLTFEVNHPEYILSIKDEDGTMVYSTVIYSTQTQVVLPSSLSGNYEIQLDFGGSYIFVGEIVL